MGPDILDITCGTAGGIAGTTAAGMARVFIGVAIAGAGAKVGAAPGVGTAGAIRAIIIAAITSPIVIGGMTIATAAMTITIMDTIMVGTVMTGTMTTAAGIESGCQH